MAGQFVRWLDRLAASLGNDDDPAGKQSRIASERVMAVLLIEIARSDHDIAPEERETVTMALLANTSLERGEIDTLFDEALAEADGAVSLHEHVRAVNERFDKTGKTRLVEDMWRVALADGTIDHQEDYTIRKLSELLHLKHRDFMQAKHHVLEERARGG
ncbi:MAG: hypothetical protein CSB44_11360 [Gammaproteobacteria bacterium]|nr:MAG: hypothetical protein CSB44_11360 [Gammaproteobacteria bacterium]